MLPKTRTNLQKKTDNHHFNPPVHAAKLYDLFDKMIMMTLMRLHLHLDPLVGPLGNLPTLNTNP